MKKVIVIGSGGAGKSTLARQLGELTGIEVIHLDSLYWRSGWQEPPKDEWQKTVEELLARDSWVMDGNFGGTMELRIAAADTVIFFDLARRVCIYRAVKRFLKYRNRARPDMAEGCNEKLDLEYLMWLWNYPKKKKPKVEALLEKYKENKKIIRITSIKEADDLLMSLGRPGVKS